ncbi:MAG: hypothetical protein C0518_05325 [Opitutus sp.]|nr:hypothetical protein [Opitutus sp.]
MKHFALLFACALAATLLAGCGKKSGEMVTYGNKDSLDAKANAAKAADPHAGHNHGGGHAHQPLMGGELVEIGEHQFNLELKFDAARGVLQAWVLDGHAENFVRTSMDAFDVQEQGGQRRTITLRATANAMTGETVGDTSSFEGEAPWLREFKHFDGVVKAIRVRGVDFRDLGFHLHPTGP